MGRDTGIANRLRAAGLQVVEVDGWQSRGSDSFNPRGGVDHHTAGSNNGNAPSLGICTNGREGLPGPLCNVLQGFDGTCYVIASGKANHAGDGGWHGLSGNSSVYGFERENDGYSDPRPGQHELAARAWSAICTGGPFGRIDSSMICGHKEWAPSRKPDFHDLNYGWFRSQIASGPAPPISHSQGEPTMFVTIDGVGLYALVGLVLFKYDSLNDYGQSLNASPKVPVLALGTAVRPEARQWLADRLFEQSVVACTGGK
jgi:hypothetical protein